MRRWTRYFPRGCRAFSAHSGQIDHWVRAKATTSSRPSQPGGWSGAPHTWGANGNLLTDGLRTYAYDHAHRLTSIVQGLDTYAFAYNGLGDRLRQTVNGVASIYTLDLETGLTQVLADGSNAYVYGLGRIAQQGLGGRQYFLGDALNSARQLVNDAGQTGLGRAYEPFGDLLSIARHLETSYGFAGEWADASGLIHLRARYYQPVTGRFIQPDPFAGVPTRPISQNPYPYAYSNPLMYTDASGRNPLLGAIVFGAALGGIIGFVGGGTFARITYDWAYQGQCDCQMQQWAHSIDGTKWVAKTALLSGAIGFVAGGLAAAGPIGEIVVGLVGYAYATYDLYLLVNEVYIRWQSTSEFGFTRCELLRFVVDVVGILGGALLASKGFAEVLESGKLLNWEFRSALPGSIQESSLEINGIRAQRVRVGSDPTKVAVIGRNMQERVEVFARGLGAETWGGFDDSLSLAENLANNRAWAETLVGEGYTVYDVGLDATYTGLGDFSKGPYYEM